MRLLDKLFSKEETKRIGSSESPRKNEKEAIVQPIITGGNYWNRLGATMATYSNPKYEKPDDENDKRK